MKRERKGREREKRKGWERERERERERKKERRERTTPCGCNVTFYVVQGRSVVDSAGSFIIEIWLEQHVHATETFGADSDDVSIWELVDKIDPPFFTESEQPP